MLSLYGLPMYWKQHRNTSVQIIKKANRQVRKNSKKVKDAKPDEYTKNTDIRLIYGLS